ncbi:MAG: hypothetical protein IT457_15700 [Planctomycetes bacterium]|nr:hypothetical protein [Planctomycetota bacterium]
MSKLPLSIAAAVAIAAGASAQQFFEIYPGTTNATSRGGLGLNSGEILNGFHKAQNAGIGNDGTSSTVSGARYVLQDQIGNTVDTYGITFRTGTDATGPGTTAVDLLASFGPFNMPASTATGPVAWIITLTFAPLTVPSTDFFSVGVALPVATSGTDYVSCHAAYNTSHNQHASAVDMAWQIVGAATSATHPATKRSFRIAIRTPQNAFQAANVDALGTFNHFGWGGYFPNTALVGAASQGLAFRAFHNLGVNGSAAVLASIGGFAASPLTIPGIGNTVYLDLATLLPVTMAFGLSDGTVLPSLAAGLDVLPAGAGTLTFQAVVLDIPNATIDMTNAVTTTLL